MAAQCNCCKWCEIDDFHVRQHFASHLLKAPSRRHYTLRRPISRERERQPRLSLPAPGLRGEGGNDPSAPAASRHAQPRRVLHPPTAKAPTTTAAWPSEARHMRFARLQPGIEPPLSRPRGPKRCRGRRGRPRTACPPAPVRFVADSPLEGDGFELPVPQQIRSPFSSKQS